MLEPGGRLCFAVVHPINSAGSFESDEPDSRFVIEGAYLEPFRYSVEVAREDLEMTFVSDHRPLQAYTDAIAAAGLLIELPREPAMPEAAESHWRKWQRVPMFLHGRAVKPGG